MSFTNLRNLAAATVVTLGATGTLQADTPLSYTNEIAPGVYSFGGGNGYHSMFLVTDEGVVAFETINTAHTRSGGNGGHAIAENRDPGHA